MCVTEEHAFEFSTVEKNIFKASKIILKQDSFKRSSVIILKRAVSHCDNPALIHTTIWTIFQIYTTVA